MSVKTEKECSKKTKKWEKWKNGNSEPKTIWWQRVQGYTKGEKFSKKWFYMISLLIEGTDYIGITHLYVIYHILYMISV